ncbi:MAG: hypothetical protein WBG50_01000, partial [Desulfomonilaceae bacterium]
MPTKISSVSMRVSPIPGLVGCGLFRPWQLFGLIRDKRDDLAKSRAQMPEGDTVYHVRASRSLSQSTRSGKYEYHAPHSRGTPKTEVTWKST